MAAFANSVLLLMLLCAQIRWSESKSCKSGRDCRYDQCCRANVRPIGKRSVRPQSLSFSSGMCQPRGSLGSGCIVPFGKPPSWNDMVAMDTCPCQKGLKCVPDGSGAVIVPQGRAGTCQPESQVVRCASASDCPAGECCVAPLRGKRALPSQKGGICQPIPNKGESCHTTSLQVGDMVASCPCADGLKCVPDGGREVPQGPTGTCQPESQVVGCDSISDCPAGECCVAPLRGKRGLPSQKGGICQPIPKEGGRCHTTNVQVGDGMVASCPCADGLKCVPDGRREVPQGPTGTCQPESQVVGCDSISDCPTGECCVAPLRGKRALPSQRGGICQPIPKKGGRCHTTCLQVGDMVASCPCADGLKCVPDGGHVVPQGPTGTCQPKSQVVGCDSISDCPAGECCVAPLRGKRALPSQKGGICQPIPKEGGRCHTTNVQVGDGMVSSCPCADGLKCVPDGGREVPQGPTGTCQPESQVGGCNSPSDCAPNECCVAPLRGKRDVSSPMGGVCQPIPTLGGGCHTITIHVSTGLVSSCPCSDGLKCVPDGGREVPQGPTGKCYPESKIVPCFSSSDCPANECCMAPFRGKRSLSLASIFSGGICLPIPTRGERCHVHSRTNRWGTMVSCPCAPGLKCVNNGSYRAFRGPFRTCQPYKINRAKTAQLGPDE